MIMGWIRSMLGPFGVIMDFFAAHPEILTGILALWMLLYAAGRIQLVLIQRRTERLVINRARRLVAENPLLTLAELREAFLPTWQEEVKKWNFLFVPHKFDFWPVPASPKNVLVKFPISPEWLAKALDTNGIKVQGLPAKKILPAAK
jgi:hypothetical protein